MPLIARPVRLAGMPNRDGFHLEIDSSVEQVGLDTCPLASFEKFHISREHSHGEQGRAMLVHNRGADRRRTIGAGGCSDARSRLNQQILSRCIAHWTRTPPTRRGSVDYIGLARSHVLVS